MIPLADGELGPIADPLLRRVFPGWRRYRSYAQAWAVQMLRNAPPGGVVLAALATGGGKTMTYLLPLLEERGRWGRAGALVIVPTISLAVDQADALSRRYPSPIGPIRAAEVHGALGPGERSSRETAFVRGEYDVLLVSPERALHPEFVERLRTMRDGLRFLVIDEVHTMVAWGETFRLAYPRLGWLRRELLLSNPELRTHLMSATVPWRVERQLRKLFDVDSHLWRTVRGSALRFEAEIQIQALDAQEHEASLSWLREHIHVLPPPALIYATRPLHAEQIGGALKEWGYRCGVYHGETPEDERQRISRQWIAGELDYVVGTSAFGLGIDKPNVRSVTHLCIPESLDRYYQEVGRAGRDGERCLANLVTVQEDADIAEGNARRLLTPDKFEARWTELVNHGECIEDTGDEVHWLIDESRKPDYAAPAHWYAASNDYHIRWNQSLLNFLQRLGLVTYEGPFPAEVTGTLNDDAVALLRNEEWQLDGRFSLQPGESLRTNHRHAPGPGWSAKRTRLLQLWRTLARATATWHSLFRIERVALEQALGATQAFRAVVEQCREEELKASFRAIKGMVRYARARHDGCYRQPIAELYGEFLDQCGNCGWCIGHGRGRSEVAIPRKPISWDTYEGRISPGIREFATGSGMFLVRYRAPLPEDLIPRLERGGIRQFVAAQGEGPVGGVVHAIEEFRPERAVFERMPTAVVLLSGMKVLDLQRLLSFIDTQQPRFRGNHPLLILLPDDLDWPGRSDYLERFPGQQVPLDSLASKLPRT